MLLSALKSMLGFGSNYHRAATLYTALVTQARSPEFYVGLGVEDSIRGRFDMILLHMHLLTTTLEERGQTGTEMSRSLQEIMVSDLDRSLRELGVGDMSVGKKMKDLAGAWFGRRLAYDEAKTLESYASAIARNVYESEDVTPAAHKLARYGQESLRALADLKDADLFKAKLTFAPIQAS